METTQIKYPENLQAWNQAIKEIKYACKVCPYFSPDEQTKIAEQYRQQHPIIWFNIDWVAHPCQKVKCTYFDIANS